MVDRQLLQQMITDSGLKKNAIAKDLGLTLKSFANKMNGFSDFKCSEAQNLGNILGMSDPMRRRIFFAKEVELKSTKDSHKEAAMDGQALKEMADPIEA